MKLLFIGNSHTYKNDLPELVSRKFRENWIDCGAVMLAQPGWTLTHHSVSPEVSFNIRFGGYDYVVLQEHAHPFEDTERYLNAVKLLSELAKSAGSIPLIYGTWARKAEPEKQAEMSAAYERAAKENDCLLADVGGIWWDYRKDHPQTELFAEDGEHPSPAGSDLAAEMIFKTIRAAMKD